MIRYWVDLWNTDRGGKSKFLTNMEEVDTPDLQ